MVGKRYAEEDIKKMQEEAIKQVKEMYTRSKSDAGAPTQHTAYRERMASNAKSTDSAAKKSERTANAQKKEHAPEKFRQPQRKGFNFNIGRTKFAPKTFPKTNINPEPPRKDNSQNLIGNLPNLIDLVFKDSDKSLLIVLIILLMDDEENFMILLVLFYLLI
jgi:hypothetical protein